MPISSQIKRQPSDAVLEHCKEIDELIAKINASVALLRKDAIQGKSNWGDVASASHTNSELQGIALFLG